jgi:hypothetical protein
MRPAYGRAITARNLGSARSRRIGLATLDGRRAVDHLINSPEAKILHKRRAAVRMGVI